MNRKCVCIINTGIANTASVAAAFDRLGCSVQLTESPEQASSAQLLVLPGVGNFGAGMDALRQRGLDSTIINRVRQNGPLLGICLGLQLMYTTSEESPGVAGLGIIDGVVTRFPHSIRTPQHGWNTVKPQVGFNGIGAGFAYYSNTYRIESCPDGWACAKSNHGETFIAALQRGSILGCQFHPELSGAWGASLLKLWVDTAEEVSPC